MRTYLFKQRGVARPGERGRAPQMTLLRSLYLGHMPHIDEPSSVESISM